MEETTNLNVWWENQESIWDKYSVRHPNPSGGENGVKQITGYIKVKFKKKKSLG